MISNSSPDILTREAMEELRDRAEAGALRPVIDRCYSLAEMVEGTASWRRSTSAGTWDRHPLIVWVSSFIDNALQDWGFDVGSAIVVGSLSPLSDLIEDHATQVIADSAPWSWVRAAVPWGAWSWVKR